MVGRPAPGGPHASSWSTDSASRDAVRFVHGISDEELVELIAAAEVAVVPSLYEGFSLPAVEQMACGTPLVATRPARCPRSSGRRRAGLLSRRATPEALAAALRRAARLPRATRAARRGGPGPGRGALHLAGRGRATVDGVPNERSRRTVLTVDFDRLGLSARATASSTWAAAAAGTPSRCSGAARDVVAFDQDATSWTVCATCSPRCGDAGEVPEGGRGDVVVGDALDLPFADGAFDRVIAAEVLEHIPDDTAGDARDRPRAQAGRPVAVTVPRWLPERICWALSDDYHTARAATSGSTRRASSPTGLSRRRAWSDRRHYAHGLHAPYWWLKCAVGVHNDEHPAVQGLPPAAGLGHHEAAPARPGWPSAARSADRQERGRSTCASRSRTERWRHGDP